MIKRFLLALMMMFVSSVVFAQQYNSIATAYVTTTISQKIVFDSTMQAGGTFTFSVLAHNGGGRWLQPAGVHPARPARLAGQSPHSRAHSRRCPPFFKRTNHSGGAAGAAHHRHHRATA